MLISLTRAEAMAIREALAARLAGEIEEDGCERGDYEAAERKVRAAIARNPAPQPKARAPRRATNFTIQAYLHPEWAHEFTGAVIDESELIHTPVGEYPDDGKTACGLAWGNLRELLPEYSYRICGECRKRVKENS